MKPTEESEDSRRVRAQLRAAAHAHRPDRARMAARVARATAEEPGSGRRTRRRTALLPLRWAGRTGPRSGGSTEGFGGSGSSGSSGSPGSQGNPGSRGPRVWPRVAGAVGALVVVLGVGATAALWARDGDGAGAERPPTVRTSAGPPRTSGSLTSRGSVDRGSNAYWSQTEVTVGSAGRLTALKVELRIADGTRKLASTGSWRTRPARDFAVSVRHEKGALVYRWTLRKGRSVPPGRHVFAGQFDHPAGKRSARDDAYTVSATSEGHRRTLGGGIG